VKPISGSHNEGRKQTIVERKLIFLDIDGTLTEPGSNTPPASALEAIRKAQANGHRVVLCSGRNYGMLSPLLQYGFDGLIGCAGGYIQYGDAVVYDCPMTEDQRQKSMAVFEANGVYRTIESRDRTYTDEAFKEFLAQNAHEGANSELLRWRRQLESNLGILPMAQYRGEPIYKIVFMSRSLDRLDEPRCALQDEFDFCIQDPDEYGIINGELINKQFNKGTAVKRLCEYLKMPLADTIAFGDSMNDLEMLQTVALSICMDNGSPTLKALANEVCPAVTEDGLYTAFRKHGLF